MSGSTGTAEGDAAAFDGARRPDRRSEVTSDGIRLAVSEWGDPDAPPLVLAHGGFDFAGTFDVFAPLLAAGGWRVVTWDQRGHGDSDRAHLYSWQADLRDGAAVVNSLPEGPMPFVGHSKGGNLVMQLAVAMPHRTSALINIDGLPSYGAMSDVSEHERAKWMRRELDEWLTHRRSLVGKQRRPGTIDELADRRGKMNPRLTPEWLRYLVIVGASESEDGWRWKIDPTMRMGGFGPWRPEWSLLHLPAIAVPVLGILGKEPEVMGWGTTEVDLEPYLPSNGRIVSVDGAGHFVHIERPQEVSEMALEFLS